MGCGSVPTGFLFIIAMPNSVEMELQGVFEPVVLLYIQKQQDCDIGG